MNFSAIWGYGGLCVVNLFAFNSTNPKTLLQISDPIGSKNDYWIKKLANDARIIVAIWGIKGSLLNRDKQVMQNFPIIYCLGMTKNGLPKHPLYLKKNAKLEVFRKEK